MSRIRQILIDNNAMFVGWDNERNVNGRFVNIELSVANLTNDDCGEIHAYYKPGTMVKELVAYYSNGHSATFQNCILNSVDCHFSPGVCNISFDCMDVLSCVTPIKPPVPEQKVYAI